jgi:predicted MPP superfamily phosphohydrolase
VPELIRRWVPFSSVVVIAALLQWLVACRLARLEAIASSPARRRMLFVGAGLLCVFVVSLPFFYGTNLFVLLPQTGAEWVLAVGLFWCLVVFSSAVPAFVWRTGHFDPSRRRLLRAGSAAVALFPMTAAGAGVVVARGIMVLRQIDVPVPGLPRDLEGLRIAQLTDIHFGTFFDHRDLARAIAMANETRPHLAVVTGDLITRRGDDLEACLNLLRTLRSDAGVLACHGNHEQYAGVRREATQLAARRGIRCLRAQAETLQFGTARLNVAGYDYQSKDSHYLPGAERLVRADATNLLLSHNPDVFPRAANAGFQVTLSGHTHGGQVTVEILNEQLNVARFFTPYVYGLYREGGSSIYVSGGLGTVGAPVRLGAPPEVTLIRLCAV